MTRTPRDQHRLKTSVANELTLTPAVDADQVGVSVHDGAVTLSGEVDSYPQKEAAVQQPCAWPA